MLHITGRVGIVPGAPFYANAKRVDPWQCWRMVRRGPGYRMGSPTGCTEPVCWAGKVVIGTKQYHVFSCDGHVDGIDKPTTSTRNLK